MGMDLATTTYTILGVLVGIGIILAVIGEIMYLIYNSINKFLKK